MRARAIFFGTPEFAVPSLLALHEVADVALVVCQPDRRSGRGLKLTAPPVKRTALSLGLEVIQPTKVRTRAFADRLGQVGADLGVVVAYGRILPERVLAVPRLGCVNVHASLLPKLRGAAPVQWAIVNGDSETGVCLMQMDAGMDTGPELARSTTPIGPDETGGELGERLAQLGADLLRTQLPQLLAGELPPCPQDHTQATLAPMLEKEHGAVRWDQRAQQVHDLVRGMSPWPGSYTALEGKRVKLHRTRVLSPTGQHGPPGTVVRADRHGIEVACGQGVVVIEELQLEGKRRVTAEQFCAGQRLSAQACFATPAA